MNPPDAGKEFELTKVALILPAPVGFRVQPVPQTMAAVVLVPVVMLVKEGVVPAVFAKTKASVASLEVLSPVVWVTAEVPFGSVGVPERLAEVPVMEPVGRT